MVYQKNEMILVTFNRIGYYWYCFLNNFMTLKLEI